MPKDATINARVDKKLKAKAELVLDRVGIRTSDLITMLLHQVVLHNGVPFDVKIPNKETRKAMAELDTGKGERFVGSAADLRRHLLLPKRRKP
jgi:DNA-damage-inducible protein J